MRSAGGNSKIPEARFEHVETKPCGSCHAPTEKSVRRPLDAAALLSAPTDHEERSTLVEAQDFLGVVLAVGRVSAREVQEEARTAGISERTLKRAKQALGVDVEREGEAGKRGGGTWYWSLPGIKGATPKGWHSKSNSDRTDGENPLYVSEEPNETLRGPSVNGSKDGTSVGPLNNFHRFGEECMAGLEPDCLHGYTRGKGCYLCDPEHPYRKDSS